MRGLDVRSGSLFSYVDFEHQVRPDHTLRTIRDFVDAAFADLSVDYDAVYPPRLGRSSIPSQRLTSIRLGQASLGSHFRSALMRAFARMMSFRMIAVSATFGGLPRAVMAWHMAAKSGLNRAATRAGM